MSSVYVTIINKSIFCVDGTEEEQNKAVEFFERVMYPKPYLIVKICCAEEALGKKWNEWRNGTSQ